MSLYIHGITWTSIMGWLWLTSKGCTAAEGSCPAGLEPWWYNCFTPALLRKAGVRDHRSTCHDAAPAAPVLCPGQEGLGMATLYRQVFSAQNRDLGALLSPWVGPGYEYVVLQQLGDWAQDCGDNHWAQGSLWDGPGTDHHTWWASAPSPAPCSARCSAGFSVTSTCVLWAGAELWKPTGDGKNYYYHIYCICSVVLVKLISCRTKGK